MKLLETFVIVSLVSGCTSTKQAVVTSEKKTMSAEKPATSDYESAINKQYGRENLGQQLLDALKANGKDLDHLTREDIAGFTEFHTLGQVATRELAALGHLRKGEKVIDLGSGLGGPAMTLASDLGVDVTAVELTEAYHDAAKLLAGKIGVRGVTFIHGNALAAPVPDHAFDVVWMQHVEMNIAEKKKLFSEIVRLLKPRGRFVTHSFLRGASKEPVLYPAPWADSADLSFLSTEEEMKKLASDAGLKLVEWKNTDAASITGYKGVLAKVTAARAPGAPAPLGLNQLMLQSTPEKFKNLLQNVEEHRVAVFMAVFEKK